MKKLQVLRKGQLVRGYLTAGTTLLVQQGQLHIQYSADHLGECLWSSSDLLFEGEIKLLEQAGWVSLSGDAAVLIMDPPPVAQCSRLATGAPFLRLRSFWKTLTAAGVSHLYRKRLHQPTR